MLASSGVSVSPSFNSYTSAHLSDIAARVGQEFNLQSDSDADFLDSTSLVEASKPPKLHLESPPLEEEASAAAANGGGDDDADDDFEFPSLSRDPDGSPISAGDIFYRGQIKPAFPLFNRDLLFSDVSKPCEPDPPPPPPPARLSLGRLFMEDRDPPSCSFSSSEDELNRVPDGSYCVWTPAEASRRRRPKKTDSMGSSRRWKFLDLFQSHSDSSRKDLLVFLPPVIASGRKKNKDVKAKPESDDSTAAATVMHKSKSSSGRVAAVALKAKVSDGDAIQATAARREHNAKEVASRGRSLLPYKEELLGFLSNVNGMSRNVPAF